MEETLHIFFTIFKLPFETKIKYLARFVFVQRMMNFYKIDITEFMTLHLVKPFFTRRYIKFIACTSQHDAISFLKQSE
jgi:hypothetical protein